MGDVLYRVKDSRDQEVHVDQQTNEEPCSADLRFHLPDAEPRARIQPRQPAGTD